MAMNKRPSGLGRGLDALLGDFEESALSSAAAIEVDIDKLYPNPSQPRKRFDEARLKELSGSISQHGLVQPIVVRRTGDRYMIITGERRYRASKLAGLRRVAVIERDYEDDAIHEIALIENIQREDLNPIEEAAAIAFLMKQHDLTQEEVSKRLFKSRPAIANTLRLLNLKDSVKEYVKSGALSAGHGRALSALDDAALQERLAKQAVESGCSVRALEQIVKAAASAQADEAQENDAPCKREKRPLDNDLYEVENQLRERFKTKVKITGSRKRGKIVIEYYSMDALTEIYEAMITD